MMYIAETPATGASYAAAIRGVPRLTTQEWAEFIDPPEPAEAVGEFAELDE